MATITTTLTANSNVTVSGSGDANQSTMCRFMSPVNGTVWWTPIVSIGQTDAVLDEDVGDATVTFRKGLRVSLTAQGGTAYDVALYGQIDDESSRAAPFKGLIIYSQS